MTRRQKNILNWIVTFLVMVIICLPGLWVVLSAFRSNGEILTKPTVMEWMPPSLTASQCAKLEMLQFKRMEGGIHEGS